MGNGEEFVSMAKKLGYNSLCFVYEFNDFRKKEFKEFKTYTAIICERNFDRAKQKADIVIASGLNARKAIESKRVDFIYSVESDIRRDSMHFRNSGLNHVLCKLMKENNVGYLVSVKDVLSMKDPQFLGRVMQNIRLCSKFKVRTEIATFASDVFEMKGASDLRSLMKELGVKN